MRICDVGEDSRTVSSLQKMGHFTLVDQNHVLCITKNNQTKFTESLKKKHSLFQRQRDCVCRI